MTVHQAIRTGCITLFLGFSLIGSPAVYAQDASLQLPVLPTQSDAKTVSKEVISEPDERYSYGPEKRRSLLFSPDKTTILKNALQLFESTGAVVKEVVEVQVEEELVPQESIDDLKAYPVFYLSSILYRHANDWSIWLSGFKITPKKNKTDVKVLSVSPHSASFSWSPNYAGILSERKRRQLFAPVATVAHRLINSPLMRFDEAQNTVYFTLKANQSFSVGYFNIFEGLIPSPALPSLTVDTDISSTTEPAAGINTN